METIGDISAYKQIRTMTAENHDIKGGDIKGRRVQQQQHIKSEIN
jgi:hypothetical protein